MQKRINFISKHFYLIFNNLQRQIIKPYSKIVIYLLLSLPLFSCTDQGCIEADDFGEYEYETLTVKANAADEYCAYNPDIGSDGKFVLVSSDQGHGLQNCFTKDKVSITDSDGNDYTSSDGGCDGLQSDYSDDEGIQDIVQMCIDNCVQQCLTSSGSGGDSSVAKPQWISTSKKVQDKNIGVTIAPGAQIYINATGNVILGDSTDQVLSARADKSSLQSLSKDDFSKEVFVDISEKQSKIIRLEGLWTNGNTKIGTGDAEGIISEDNAVIKSAFNGLRRLVMYLVDHPEEYSFDYSSGIITGVPLDADTDLWTCDYKSPSEPSCNSLDYSKKYTISDTANNVAGNLYGITANEQASNLGTSGGMIRWKDDGLTPWDTDPFSNVKCDVSGCTGSVTGEIRGELVGDASSTFEWPNTANYAYRFSFKNLLSYSGVGNNPCNTTAIVSIKDKNDNSIELSDAGYELTVPIDDQGWSKIPSSNDYLTLEPGDKLSINITKTFQGNDPTPTNCGEVIALRFDKLHDIKISKSGFVSFSTLNSGNISDSGSCILNARIINPLGDRNYFSFSEANAGIDVNGDGNKDTVNYKADFYEYDSLYTSTQFSDNEDGNDPLNNLSVNVSSYLNADVSGFYAKDWSDHVFVRKGQIIRFNPESWNGTWGGSSVTAVECGKGMAMKIVERPAYLCRGNAEDEVNDPRCYKDIKNDETTGEYTGETFCSAYSPDCYDKASGSYCPINSVQISEDSKDTISCQEESVKDGSEYWGDTGKCTEFAKAIDGMNKDKCRECYNDMQSNAYTTIDANDSSKNVERSSTESLSLDQCYNFENYTGRVSNIPEDIGFSGFSVGKTTDYESVVKGLERLGSFNGNYGNFEDSAVFSSNVGGNENTVYSFNQVTTFDKNARVKLMVLDGNNFKDVNDVDEDYIGTSGSEYDNLSSGSKTAYTSDNGYKVTLVGNAEFSNGEMLEVVLCEESSDNSYDCSLSDITNSRVAPDKKVPLIVELNSGSRDPDSLKGYYKFDSSGDLIKFENLNADNSYPAPNNDAGYDYGSKYYIHYYSGSNNDSSRLRLSFRIKDSDETNCAISKNSSGNDGIKINNSYYVKNGECVKYDQNSDGSYVLDSNQNPTCTKNIASGNNGELCQPGEVPGSDPGQCQKQFVCVDPYANNSGSYKVTVKSKIDCNQTKLLGIADVNICGSASQMVEDVITPVIEIMDGKPDGTTEGEAERIYKLIIQDSRYHLILQLCLITMVTFYGIGYLMGVSEFSQAEILIRVIKIGIIYLFVGPDGWQWFETIFVNLFKNTTDYLAFIMASSFDNSPDIQNAIANSDFYDKSILFSSVDNVLSLFFSTAVQNKISALLFASIFGWAYLYIIYAGLLLYIYAVANAVLLYLTAQVFISILFVLGPIFFVLLIFNQTKDMFDKWLSALIGFSLQQIFLLTTLSFFNMMMYEVIKMAFSYRVCWDDVWVVDLGVTRVKVLSFWTIGSLPSGTSTQIDIGNVSDVTGVPSVFNILFIWLIASLMNKFIGFMTDLASGISSGIKASSLSSGIANTARAFKNTASKNMEKALAKTVRPVIQRADKTLFDSGKLADQERRDKKVKDKKDMAVRSAMSKAGDEAIKEYKKYNADKLTACKTEAEKKEILEGVRKTAQYGAAERLGYSKTEADRVMKHKGLQQTTAQTGLGLLANLGKEAFTRGGALTTSLEDQDIDTSISEDDITSTMENIDKTRRDAFTDNLESNKTDVRSSSAARKIGNSIANNVAGSWRRSKKRNPSEESMRIATKKLAAQGEIDEDVPSLLRTKEENEKIRREAFKIDDEMSKEAHAAGSTSATALAHAKVRKRVADELEGLEDKELTRDSKFNKERRKQKKKAGKEARDTYNKAIGAKIAGGYKKEAKSASKEASENQKRANNANLAAKILEGKGDVNQLKQQYKNNVGIDFEGDESKKWGNNANEAKGNAIKFAETSKIYAKRAEDYGRMADAVDKASKIYDHACRKPEYYQANIEEGRDPREQYEKLINKNDLSESDINKYNKIWGNSEAFNQNNSGSVPGSGPTGSASGNNNSSDDDTSNL